MSDNGPTGMSDKDNSERFIQMRENSTKSERMSGN